MSVSFVAAARSAFSASASHRLRYRASREWPRQPHVRVVARSRGRSVNHSALLLLSIALATPSVGLSADRTFTQPAVLAPGIPVVSPAARGPLTLLEAQRLAVQRSLQLVAHDASGRSSREMAVAAGQLPDPTLTLGIRDLPIEGADRFSLTRDNFTMREIGVMQEFTRGEKRRLRAQRFEREADRALAEKNASLAVIQRETATAWLDSFYLERLRAAIAEQAQETRLEITAAEGAYRGGRGSQADVLTTHSSRVMLEDRLSELDRRIRSARVALARWIGHGTADPPLAGEPEIDTVPVHVHALAEQLQRHPNIAVMSEEIAISQTEVALAQANRRADWTGTFMYQKRGSNFSDMVSFNVSIPLQWDQKRRQDRELAAKLALAEKAQAQRDDALRQHIAEVQTLLNEWENGRERLVRYQSELVPLARNRTQAVLGAYRGGKSDATAVVTARRNEIEVLAQSLQLQLETSRAWAQLRFLYPDEAISSAAHSTTSGQRGTPVDARKAQ